MAALERSDSAWISQNSGFLKTGVLFEKLEPPGQRELLLHLVKKVVVSVEGQIVRIELRAPFGYLHELAAQQGRTAPQTFRGSRNRRTSQVYLASSRMMSVCAPTGSLAHTSPQARIGIFAGLSAGRRWFIVIVFFRAVFVQCGAQRDEAIRPGL